MTNNANHIAIVVGAGAVENAWEPILDAFKMAFRTKVDIDAANCLFARHVYLLRFYSKFPNPKGFNTLEEQIETVNFLKGLICHKIDKAQEAGILKPRKEFVDIFNKFALNNMFGFVSTNWDTVIDKEADRLVKQAYKDIDSAKCFHIHGSIEDPNDLYLPSETTLENYRSDKENEKFGLNHYVTMQFLNDAHQILLYGLSLDPLDAELSQLLNSVFSTSKILKEVIIINPEYSTVHNRLKFLMFPRTDIKVTCYRPDNLNLAF